MIIYKPQDSMCANCQHKNSTCKHLDFSKMSVIEQVKVDDDYLNIVRCTNFEGDYEQN